MNQVGFTPLEKQVMVDFEQIKLATASFTEE
jgi:hypothetical protein